MAFKQFDINLTRLRYDIESEGVSVTKKKLFTTDKRFIPFENIGSQRISKKNRKPVWLIVACIFFALTLFVFIKRLLGATIGDGAEVFWLAIGAAFFFIYAFSGENRVLLVKEKEADALEFIGSKIYRRQTDKFIKELLQQRDDFLSRKYPAFEGLSTAENMLCIEAAVPPADGLLLKKQTKNKLEKLTFDNDHSEGISILMKENVARKFLEEQQQKFINEGKYLFISNIATNAYRVALIATTSDPYTVMKLAGTNGCNYGVDTTDIIAKYKQWDKEFGIRPIGIGSDFCECEIENKDIDYVKLAAEVYEFCPDVVEQGTDTVEQLESEMRNTGRIFLWWD